MNEVRIASGELRKALAFAASVTERRNTIPVLGMVLIEIDRPFGRVTGTDLDMEASASFEIADTGKPFSFLISPRLLGDVIRFAENLITISKADDILTIKADDMEVQVLSLLPVEDWPAVQGHADQYQPTGISEARLDKAMRAVATSISTEETRYYLNGAYFHDAGDGVLTIVSTDGHRLTKYETEHPWPEQRKLIVPRKTCHTLMTRLTSGGNKSVEIATAENRISFRGDGWQIRSKCIDGTFPDYNRAIPAPSDKISFALTDAALRRFPRTGERSRAIKIDPDAGKMSVIHPDGITATMPISGRGQAVGFNIEYLKTFAALSGTIRISGASKDDPFRVLSEDPRLVQFLMPMRV